MRNVAITVPCTGEFTISVRDDSWKINLLSNDGVSYMRAHDDDYLLGTLMQPGNRSSLFYTEQWVWNGVVDILNDLIIAMTRDSIVSPFTPQDYIH